MKLMDTIKFKKRQQNFSSLLSNPLVLNLETMSAQSIAQLQSQYLQNNHGNDQGLLKTYIHATQPYDSSNCYDLQKVNARPRPV
jgi:hypothetical protein